MITPTALLPPRRGLAAWAGGGFFDEGEEFGAGAGFGSEGAEHRRSGHDDSVFGDSAS